jgi:rRNA-processing protein FCF1
VEVVHAPGEGDDAIVALAADSPDPVVVVTADRGLAERVRQTGGDVVGPSWLLERLDQSAR